MAVREVSPGRVRNRGEIHGLGQEGGGRVMQTRRGGAVGFVLAFAFFAFFAPAGPWGMWLPPQASAQANTWTVGGSPSPAGLMANQLNAVSCPASGDCLAVGSSSTPSGTWAVIETLVPNGWALATAAQVPGSYVDDLLGHFVRLGYFLRGGRVLPTKGRQPADAGRDPGQRDLVGGHQP